MTSQQVFFHITTHVAAASILDSGFRDQRGSYMTDRTFEGIWISDVPFEDHPDPSRAVILRIAFPSETDLSPYEWIEEVREGEQTRRYREWLVPAELINSAAAVSMVSE